MPDYIDKRILAPMVRVGTLPMRLLAAEYGADLVYTEELIDKRLMHCTRVNNSDLGTVDFIDNKGVLLLRTLAAERERTVLQIGTSAPDLALAAASVAASEVTAIDVNMGCPLAFSVSGGMGSALLKKPETVREILTTLRRNLPNAITCKIRLLPTPEETAEFARMVEHCGVDALGVHGRYVLQRPRDPAHWDRIAEVVRAVSVPVIANGDVFAPEDWGRIREATGAASAMAARGAMWNPSIFRREGLLPPAEVRRAYVQKAVVSGNSAGNTKFCLREMMVADKTSGGLESAEGKALNAAKTLARPLGPAERSKSPVEAIAAVYGVAVPKGGAACAAEEADGEETSRGQRPAGGGGGGCGAAALAESVGSEGGGQESCPPGAEA